MYMSPSLSHSHTMGMALREPAITTSPLSSFSSSSFCWRLNSYFPLPHPLPCPNPNYKKTLPLLCIGRAHTPPPPPPSDSLCAVLSLHPSLQISYGHRILSRFLSPLWKSRNLKPLLAQSHGAFMPEVATKMITLTTRKGENDGLNATKAPSTSTSPFLSP